MATAESKKEYWTLQEIADRWNCSHSTVLSHCHAGELRAVDVSTNRRKRSHYIVPTDALLAFEQSRETPPPSPPAPRRNRVKVRPNEVIEFFS